MIDHAISNEKDSKLKNKLVGIRGNILHKKPLTKSQTELAKKYNILESKENINKMKTQKIKLTELKQLVKQIIKEEQSNKKVIKESKDFTVQEFLKNLKDGPYAFPGGYPKYFITKDGGILSFQAAKEMKDEIISAIKDGYDDQWLVVGVDINWEDSDLYCDHTNEKIECAYCEDEPIQESTKPKTQKIKLSEVRQLVRGMLKEGSNFDKEGGVQIYKKLKLTPYNTLTIEFEKTFMDDEPISIVAHDEDDIFIEKFAKTYDEAVEIAEKLIKKIKNQFLSPTDYKLKSQDAIDRMQESVKQKTQKIKLTELRQLVRNILKENVNNYNIIDLNANLGDSEIFAFGIVKPLKKIMIFKNYGSAARIYSYFYEKYNLKPVHANKFSVISSGNEIDKNLIPKKYQKFEIV